MNFRALIDIYFAVMSDLQPLEPRAARAVGRCGEHPVRRRSAGDGFLLPTGSSAKRSKSGSGSRARPASSPDSIDAQGLATVIIAMLRGVALQSLIDDQVDPRRGPR